MKYNRDPERIRKVLGKKVQFILGDMACVYGGLIAGCSFFGGYPITPASEVAEGMARRLPRVGGTYIQMEDEIGSIAAVIGAAWGGAKSMTATSGPGFSLMMENYGFAAMTETPCVIVNVQRTGPSTGQPGSRPRRCSIEALPCERWSCVVRGRPETPALEAPAC